MKSVLFARVSSREQEETGYSLPSQEKLLKDYAERKGFRIAKLFSISESASGKTQRGSFNEMVSYIKEKNIKVIICEKVDRLTRNLKDAVSINDWINKDKEREVHFVKENCILNKESKSNEKFIWNIKVSVAQYYIDNLSEEVKKGQMEKIKQGWLPTKPPLGYMTTGEKGHKIHIVDEKVVPLIRKMFKFYATGSYSLKRLTQVMYGEGLRTKGGYKLVKSRMAGLLTDPFYYGGIRWNNETYPGKQKPIISKDLFDRVQVILKRKNTPKYKKHLSLFGGIIRCKECDGLITWEKHKGHWYGHCNHYRNCSQKTWVREEKIEEQILPYFDQITIRSKALAEWIRKALKESHKEETDYHNKSLGELSRNYERIQKRLNMLYDDKLDGKITPEFYEQKFNQYTQEKEAVVASIEKHSNAQTKYFEVGVNVFDLSQNAKELYKKAPVGDRKALLSFVFSNLVLNEGKLTGNYAKPFDILANAVDYTNNIFEPQFYEQKSPDRAISEKLLRG